MRKLTLATVTLALLIAGCGSDTTTVTTTEPEDTTATEGEVTESFSEWRYKRAARVGDTEVAITVDNISCEIDSPGEATCYETVTYDSVYLGKTREQGVWAITYVEDTGELITAESFGTGSANSEGTQWGALVNRLSYKREIRELSEALSQAESERDFLRDQLDKHREFDSDERLEKVREARDKLESLEMGLEGTGFWKPANNILALLDRALNETALRDENDFVHTQRFETTSEGERS